MKAKGHACAEGTIIIGKNFESVADHWRHSVRDNSEDVSDQDEAVGYYQVVRDNMVGV